MSLDGKIATRSGQSRWISGEESRAGAHALRAQVDAVAVGFRTADLDDPELSLRLAEGDQPIRLLVDPLLALDPERKLIAQAREIPSWVLHRDDVSAEDQDRLAAAGVVSVPVPASGPRGIDLASGWQELGQRGLKRVMVEGGGGLLDQLCRADCLDQVQAFLAPRILGSKNAPTPISGLGYEDLDSAPQLCELHWHASGEDLAVGAFFLDPE
ncbi:MAG: RibD family protein [Planctomycetota bacterium]